MAPARAGEGDWGEYRKLVLDTLERIEARVNSLEAKFDTRGLDMTQTFVAIRREIADVRSDISVLQFKSGLWGFAAGAIPSALALIYTLIKH